MNLKDHINQSFAGAKALTYQGLRSANYLLYKAIERPLYAPWVSPSKDFEKATNTSGISQEYAMPSGRTIKNIADQIRFAPDQDLFTLNELLDEIIALNPIASEIAYERDNWRHVCDVISGITSEFNVDDINYYIRTSGDNSLELDANQQKRFVETTVHGQKIGQSFGYIPSPKTICKVRAQFNLAADWTPSKEEYNQTVAQINNSRPPEAYQFNFMK